MISSVEISGNKNDASVSKSDGSQGLFLSHFAGENPVKNLAIEGLICYNKCVSVG